MLYYVESESRGFPSWIGGGQMVRDFARIGFFAGLLYFATDFQDGASFAKVVG